MKLSYFLESLVLNSLDVDVQKFSAIELDQIKRAQKYDCLLGQPHHLA